jgi:outer membrane receptor protein involved in Fe transport
VIKGSHHDDLLQETSVSVTSFNTKELQDLRIQNIADLAEYTPNLDINTRSAASNPTLFIRGIGLKDYNANASGAVAVYQDGININAPAIQLFQLFDVGSIEVLRGPQGSGSGRNATAGAIKVNSLLPDGGWASTASFTYGNYNTIQTEGALSFPLVEDILSARFAFTANFRDGITDNECADWNPEAHTNLLTGQPFNRVNQTTIESDYASASAGDVANPGILVFRRAGSNTELVPAIYDPPVGQPDRSDLLNRLNAEYGIQLRQLAVNPSNRNDPRNRLVGLQDNKFSANLNQVDGVCILQAPGNVLTPLGFERGFGQGKNLAAGDFDRLNVPSLEDFQGLKSRVNDVHDWAGRGILRLQPFEDMDWILNAHGGRNRSDSRHLQMIGANALPDGGFVAALQTGFSEANAATLTGIEGLTTVPGLLADVVTRQPGGQTGGDPYSGWYNLDGTEFLDAYGSNLRGTWDLGRTVLNSLTGYEWYERFVEDEGDANPGNTFPADYSDSAWQVSQELRARGEGERYQWNVGAYFLYESLDASNLFPNQQSFKIEQTWDQKLWSVGPYVGGRYELTEELSLESGVRYNVEHKDFTLSSKSLPTQAIGVPTAAIEEQQVSDTWKGVTGDVTLGYAPFWSALDVIQNDSLNLYLKYGRAMKPGHFNAALTIRAAETEQRIDPVEPEFIHAVETGAKSVWLDDRLTLNVAGFRYWYKDLQVFDIANEIGELPLQKLLNSDARVWGAEVELSSRPLPGLFLQAGFGWLDATFKDFTVRKATLAPRGQGDLATFDYDGNPLISAPRYSVSGIVEYEIPLSRFGSLIPQYAFSWRSKAYLDPQALDPISQEPYWLHNARLTYRTPDGRIEIAGWVENFLNQYYKEDVFDLTRDFDTILEVWGDPRTYGFTVTYRW